MSEPYYQDDSVTIYHGDCRDVVVDGVDALVTDPPYGVGFNIHASRREAPRAPKLGIPKERGDWVKRGGWGSMAGDDQPFDPRPWLRFPVVVLWGANYFSDLLPPSPSWLVWDKTGGGRGPDDTYADVELAWTNTGGQALIFSHLWKGLTRGSERLGRAGGGGQRMVIHPTQKPVALMRWVLDQTTKPGDLVFDPFMGSGPIAQACSDMGRRYVGVELEERYCRTAVQRLAQGVLDFGAAG